MATNDLSVTTAITPAPNTASATNNMVSQTDVNVPASAGAKTSHNACADTERTTNKTDEFGSLLGQLLSAADTSEVATELATEVEPVAAAESADVTAQLAGGILSREWLITTAATTNSVEIDRSTVAAEHAAASATQACAARTLLSPVLLGVDGRAQAFVKELALANGQSNRAYDLHATLAMSASVKMEAQQLLVNGSASSDGIALAAGVLSVSQTPGSEHSPVRAHVGAPAWADELGGKLTWMVERGVQSGSLRLSPEHLGPLEVRISINNDQASVWFGAAHADTRAALEQALPRLRELFASQGLNLTDAGVFREPPREQAKSYPTVDELLSKGRAEELRIVALRARGIVDAYA